MISEDKYLFTSPRLGFRQWSDADIDALAQINSDPLVMEFFPSTQTREKTKDFIERMQNQFREKGFCYFAVDRLEDGAFIGFIGISELTFVSDFTPCFDIGWRLHQDHWNNRYASEGARRCLNYAFDQLKMDEVYAIAPKVNLRSEQIMMKIGMTKLKEFSHPSLADDERLERCILYKICRTDKGL